MDNFPFIPEDHWKAIERNKAVEILIKRQQQELKQKVDTLIKNYEWKTNRSVQWEPKAGNEGMEKN